MYVPTLTPLKRLDPGVVDGNVADNLYREPARLTTASNGLVHDVVCNQEECLQLQRNG